jgi:dUTP pyrophosphatase
MVVRGRARPRTPRVASGVVSGSVDAPPLAPSTAPPAAHAPAGPPVDERRTVLPVPVLRLDADLPLPAYARAGDAGLDLACTADVTLAPGDRALVGTGIALALPEGHAGFVHPRSGLAAHLGVTVANAPGTVDAGYRGEIRVCLVNLGRDAVTLRRGDRIAQLVVQRVEHVRLVEVDALPPSERGTGGHGSSGGHARPGGAAP